MAPDSKLSREYQTMRCLLPALALVLLTACQPLLNTLTPSGGYGVARDVTYNAQHRLTLDVYRPEGASDAPVVVFFYGGRWSTGSKFDYKYVGEALASEGFVAVLPDIRHYPEAKFAGFMADAAAAVAWAAAQAAHYGGDPGRLFVLGHSSGAHIAAMLALNREYLDRAGGKELRLRGMIGLSGPYDFMPILAPDLRDMFGPPERFPLSQPVTFADGDNPPLLLLHGEDDDTVAVKNTESLAAAVAHQGGPVEKVIYPKMAHGWMIATLSSTLRSRTDVLDQVSGFIRRQSTAVPKAPVQTQQQPTLRTRPLPNKR